jgi:hypothetical protein
MRRLPRLTVLAAALACALLAAGCGNRLEVRTQGETEGLYLDIDELKYQVQISRYMNPADVEDRAYFTGMSEGATELGGDETWFGVFIRVSNSTDEEITPANQFEIHDTQENIFRSVPLDNEFAYKPEPIPPKGLIPQPDSVSSTTTTQGALLLFKVKTSSLQNRPLELRFRRGSGVTGIVDLDV